MSSPASAARSGSATIAREIDGQGWPPSLKFNEHIDEVEQFYIRFCFPDTTTADAFRNRFGGERLIHALDKSKPRASKHIPAKEPG